MSAQVLELVDRGVMTNSISLYIGYSKNDDRPVGGTRKLGYYTDSLEKLTAEFEYIFRQKVDKKRLIRKIAVGLNNLSEHEYINLDFFTDYEAEERERKKQNAILEIKKKYGKNSILKGMNLEEHGTTRERNHQIGGHKSGR